MAQRRWLTCNTDATIRSQGLFASHMLEHEYSSLQRPDRPFWPRLNRLSANLCEMWTSHSVTPRTYQLTPKGTEEADGDFFGYHSVASPFTAVTASAEMGPSGVTTTISPIYELTTLRTSIQCPSVTNRVAAWPEELQHMATTSGFASCVAYGGRVHLLMRFPLNTIHFRLFKSCYAQCSGGGIEPPTY